MNFSSIIFLTFIQGFSEFLPISSSGHLIIFKNFLHSSLGINFDIALHLGTLLAILVYYFKDIVSIIKEFFTSFKKPVASKLIQSSMGVKLVIATVPSVILGFLFMKYGVEDLVRNPYIVCVNLILFGLVLYYSDTASKADKNFKGISLKDAFIIGCSQVVALIPGVSRSGITITAARFLKINREDSIKFSMLLSIPTILGAIVLTAVEIIKSHASMQDLYPLFLGIIFSFLFGLIFLSFLINFVKRFSFKIFVYYRIIIALTVVYILVFLN